MSRLACPVGPSAARWRRHGVGLALAVWLEMLSLCGQARAFGGLHSAAEPEAQSLALEVVFVDRPGPKLTALVRSRPGKLPQEDFIWLLPLPSRAQLELSSSLVFERLHRATVSQYWVESGADTACPSTATPISGAADPAADPYAPSAVPMAPTDTQDLLQRSLAPAAVTRLVLDPTTVDPFRRFRAWLVTHRFPADMVSESTLRRYAEAGHHWLVLHYKPTAQTRTLRPLALTYEASEPVLPLRPWAGTSTASLELHVWIVGPSQAVPLNYRSLVLNQAALDWSSVAEFPAGTLPSGGGGPFGSRVDLPSNYMAVVAAAVAEAGGQGFVSELAGPASQYRELLFAETDRTELSEPLLEPLAVAGQLFHSGPYLTRFYARLSAERIAANPTFGFNSELAQIDNVHVARKRWQCKPAAPMHSKAMQFQLPQGAYVTLVAGQPWPLDMLPANLKVVQLGASGAGRVVVDERPKVVAGLRRQGADVGAQELVQGSHGLRIGGNQWLSERPVAPPASSERDAVAQARNVGPTAGGGGCQLATGSTDSSRTPRVGWRGWLGVLLLWLALRWRRLAPTVLAVLLGLANGGCDSTSTSTSTQSSTTSTSTQSSTTLTAEQLRDPRTCKGCHPTHYREWSASMHAYAAQDPVFLAMNRRGQRETQGKLGDFCLKCHAPMAVYDGLTRDGLNLEQLPDFERGVSCYFCHNAVGVDGDHNGMLRLANDTTMRGPIRDPARSSAHGTEYSQLLTGDSLQNTTLCGGCHDIVNPQGVRLERTFAEYRHGLYSKAARSDSSPFETCAGCHMPPRKGYVATTAKRVGKRTLHEHLWAGVDVALTDFPHREALRSAVAECQLGLGVGFFTLEVTPPDLFTFQIEAAAGHNLPSGAAQDRRMWIEFSAYDDDGQLLTDISSGRVADDEVVDKPVDHPDYDPRLVIFRDRIYDETGQQVHMFWEAAGSAAHPRGYESGTLPVGTTTYVHGKHAVIKQYRAAGSNGLPARVTARLKMRPMGLDLLRDLVASGDLAPEVVAEMPTFVFPASIEWQREDGVMKVVAATPTADCSHYRCLLDPHSDVCE